MFPVAVEKGDRRQKSGGESRPVARQGTEGDETASRGQNIFQAGVLPGGGKGHPSGKAAPVGKIFRFCQGALVGSLKYVVLDGDLSPRRLTWSYSQ